MKIKLSNFL